MNPQSVWKRVLALSRFLCVSSLLVHATACQPGPVEGTEEVAAEVHVGYVIASNGKPVQLRYTIEDGQAVQGDMGFGPAEAIAPTEEEALRRLASVQAQGVEAQVMYIAGGMWPGGTVYYQWDASLPSGNATRNVLQQAITYINSKTAETGVRLVEGTNGGRYVKLIYGSDRADVGYKGTVQSLYFWNSLWQVGVHELGHTMGLWHEHQRCEQGTYLYIYAPSDPNIAAQCNQPTVPNQPYNTLSIMHYSKGELGTRADFKPGVTVAPAKSVHPGFDPYDIRNLAYLYKTPDNAKFIGYQNLPTTLAPGQAFTATAVFENTGSNTWSIAANYKLGAQNPQDNMTWGANRVALPGSIGPGQWAYIS
ncbi:MAG TPA: M12 family metallopeptidase, partial [Archangium sp.]|uniref:M12 family metallopeptidase n=1 Tax=Archangium sp. TaxID=1872627 RepID=UPI002ED7731A